MWWMVDRDPFVPSPCHDAEMRSPRRLAALVVLVLAASSPVARATTYEPQITHGTDASPGAYPFMVGLLTASNDGNFDAQFCGGSLIDASWVLTAAHCVIDEGATTAPGDIEVLVGATDLSTNEGTRVAVDEITVHEDYDIQTQRNDLALVHLASAQTEEPIAMAGADDAALEAAGTTVRLLGWGGTTTDQADQTYATTLQQADMPIVADSTCAADLDGFSASGMLCAGAPEDDADGGIDACQGDSGGPLFATDDGTRVQVGIVSFGPTCGQSLTAYTRVSAYADWIESTMAGGVAPVEPDDPGLPIDVYRVSGADRFQTAAAFAVDRFTRPVPYAYLVTGTAFPDALAVAPLAAKNDGVLLLAERDRLPSATRDALAALIPSHLYVVGGQGAISDAVADQAAAIAGTSYTRVAGADRYSTAVEVSKLVARRLPAEFPWVFVASGTAFADALGGAAAAASDPPVPLLLTDGAALSEVTAREIARLHPTRAYLLGGTGAVSDAVADAIAALGPEVVRLAGANRYETSAAIATTIFRTGSVEVITATGRNYPDALVAGSLGRPLLLVPEPDDVPASVTDAVTTLGADVITVMGGTGAVSDDQARTLAAARA
jgi:secreted trypsin-like serine protease/putative cell wall-binding protein